MIYYLHFTNWSRQAAEFGQALVQENQQLLEDLAQLEEENEAMRALLHDLQNENKRSQLRFEQAEEEVRILFFLCAA
jgi:hypothetical protein